VETKQDFLNAIYACGDADLKCRMDRIESFGLAGMRDALSGVSTAYKAPTPGPSLDTIEKLMAPIYKWLGNTLGQPFKLYQKAFKLYYKPHFKVLKMMEKSMDRYWGAIDFLSWSMETVIYLQEKIDSYTRSTGNFDFQSYLIHFNKLEGQNFDNALKQLRLTSNLIAEFDAELLADLKELVATLNKGIDEVLKLKPAETVPDQIALGRVSQDLQMLYIDTSPHFRTSVDRLLKHYESWRLVDGGKRSTIASFSADITQFERRLKLSIEKVQKLMSGRK
jgi:hypothetical protein